MESFNNKLRIALFISLGALGTYGVISHRPAKEPVKTEQIQDQEAEKDDKQGQSINENTK